MDFWSYAKQFFFEAAVYVAVDFTLRSRLTLIFGMSPRGLTPGETISYRPFPRIAAFLLLLAATFVIGWLFRLSSTVMFFASAAMIFVGLIVSAVGGFREARRLRNPS